MTKYQVPSHTQRVCSKAKKQRPTQHTQKKTINKNEITRSLYRVKPAAKKKKKKYETELVNLRKIPIRFP